jgi:hypothetical protein
MLFWSSKQKRLTKGNEKQSDYMQKWDVSK